MRSSSTNARSPLYVGEGLQYAYPRTRRSISTDFTMVALKTNVSLNVGSLSHDDKTE